MKRLLPYLAFALSVFGMGLYAGGYVWSSSILEFNTTTESFYANWTQNDWVDPYAFNITIGNNLSNTATWIVLNITNTTMLRTSAGDFADIVVMNNTANPNQFNISRFSFANLTVRFNASLLGPGRYTGNLTIVNSTNANAKIDNLTVRLDISLTINQTYFRSNNFFGNISTLNKFDVFFFNITSASGVYVNVNDSALDLLLFDGSGNLVAHNNTNSTLNRTLLYPFLIYNSFYELRVFANVTNASQYKPYNGIVEFSPLNSSLRFLNFGQVNATPDAANPTRVSFNLNDTNQVNLSTVTETQQIFRIERYINFQNSTNFTIPVAGNYVSIDAVLEWNNISADFNLTVYNSSRIVLVNQSKRTDMFNVTGLGFDRIFSRVTLNINEFNKSWYVSVKGDPLVYYNLTVKINIGNSWLNSSFGNYTRMYIFNATQNSTAADLNVTVPLISTDGQYNGTLTYLAETGHYMTIPFGINVTEPILMVNSSFTKILIFVTDNVGTNKTLDYLLTINNTGTYALTLNDTNSTSLNSSGSDTVSFNYSFANPVSARGSSLFRIRLNISTLSTAAGETIYYGWVKLNASNAHPYSDFIVNITLNLTDKLNVMVSNVANQTDKGVWINPINKTENYTTLTTTDPVFVNVTVNVTYQNGTFVNILNATNFTVWLQSEFPYEGSNFTQNFTGVNVSVLQTVPSQNNYVLNISIPSTIAGGNYSVYATVYDASSGIRNSGTAKFNYLYVNSSALVIDAYNGTHDNDEFFGTGNRDLFVNVTNIGGGALFNVSLEVSVTGSCTSTASGYSRIYNIGNLSGFSRYSNTSATWKITINSNSTCTATITGLGPQGVWILNDTLVYAYQGTFISSGGSGSSSGGGLTNALSLAISTGKLTYFKASPVSFNFTVTSGGSNIEAALVKFNITDPKGVKVSDSSCTTTTGKCYGSYTPVADVVGTFKLSATTTKDGYTSAAATKTFDVAGYNATIPAYTKTIYVLQGNSNTTTATVRNSGSFDSAMSLAIKDVDSSWFNVTPSKPFIGAGQTTDFNVNFTIPADAVVRNYTGKYSVIADTEMASEYFYLIVTPTEKTKSEINATVLNYTEILKALEARLNLTTFPAINSTELKIAGEKINLAASLLSQAADYLSKGDYVKASELTIQAKSLLDAAEALIKTVESGQGSKRFENILFVAGAVAGVLLAGLLVYMFLPEPGYSPSKGYTMPEQAGKVGKVKQRFKKIENIVQEILDKIKELAEKLSGKKGGDYNIGSGV